MTEDEAKSGVSDNVMHLDCFENSVILTLEHCLAKARAGEVASLFIAGGLKTGEAISCAITDGGSDVFALLGRIEASKIELAMNKVEGLTRDIDHSEDRGG